MQQLYSILRSLTGAEWQAFQIFLTAFTPHDPERLKDLQLAKLLIQSEQCPTEETLCLEMYGSRNARAFRMLKSRLREKKTIHELARINTNNYNTHE
jgi:hypothetical protein